MTSARARPSLVKGSAAGMKAYEVAAKPHEPGKRAADRLRRHPSSTVRGLKKRADEVKTLLEQQQALLRRRGISLPDNAIDPHLVAALQHRHSLARLPWSIRTCNFSSCAAWRRLPPSSIRRRQTDEVLNQVMETVIQLTQAERGYIVLKNRETGELEFKLWRGA